MDRAPCLPSPPGPPLTELAARLGPERRAVLLDSGPGPEGADVAWNMLVFDPVEVLEHGASDVPVADPERRAFGRLEAALDRHWPGRRDEGPPPAGAPPFRGGVVGAFGYDLGRELERLPSRVPADAALPDMVAGVYPFVLAEHRGDGRRLVVGRGTEAQALDFARRVGALASMPASSAPERHKGAAHPAVLRSTFDRAGFEAAVERIREHILDGDVYQVNLAQRLELSGEACGLPAARLLESVRERSPAPYGVLLVTPVLELLSNSPELFLRRRAEQVVSRPIKGTRPRGRDPDADARLRTELEQSAKERAELAMIVDLVRNDLGRSAAPGSVTVELPFVTDTRATVFHRHVDVCARVPTSVSSGALVEAAWPPASVTGTPKLSALGVIESLEPVRRHLYTGALGWFDAGGDVELSVAIRIVTRVGGRLLVPVGSGITLASDPGAEYDETLDKARAWLGALGVARPQEALAP